jgi:hypothetical protein
MQIKKKTKYLLTTSEDGKVIVAEVPHNHHHNEKEYTISLDMIRANVSSGRFTEVTGQLDWDGKVWMMTEDLT